MKIKLGGTYRVKPYDRVKHDRQIVNNVPSHYFNRVIKVCEFFHGHVCVGDSLKEVHRVRAEDHWWYDIRALVTHPLFVEISDGD
jgi:hypothetical protein